MEHKLVFQADLIGMDNGSKVIEFDYIRAMKNFLKGTFKNTKFLLAVADMAVGETVYDLPWWDEIDRPYIIEADIDGEYYPYIVFGVDVDVEERNDGEDEEFIDKVNKVRDNDFEVSSRNTELAGFSNVIYCSVSIVSIDGEDVD